MTLGYLHPDGQMKHDAGHPAEVEIEDPVEIGHRALLAITQRDFGTPKLYRHLSIGAHYIGRVGQDPLCRRSGDGQHVVIELVDHAMDFGLGLVLVEELEAG